MLNIYKASAGSGKTYTLAKEYIRLLLSSATSHKTPYAEILAVTFTKKATAEMKARILKELNQLATAPQQSAYYEEFKRDFSFSDTELQQRAKQYLFAILQDYTRFQVSTIDGFFQQVVRLFARELGLPATYNVSLQEKEIVEQAVDDLLFSVHQNSTTDNPSFSWLSTMAQENIANQKAWNPKLQLTDIAGELLTERLQTKLPELRKVLASPAVLSDYKQQMQELVNRWNELHAQIGRKRNLDDDQIQCRKDGLTAMVILKRLNELGLLVEIKQQIERTNQELNRLPISDTNLLLHRVIDGAESPFIYEKIGNRLRHFMIDEFQDTSHLQWDNFFPLLQESEANGDDNLIVGDIKQSIYRFRNSDWHLLEQINTYFHHCNLPKMDTNFRSSAIVVEANNHIFQLYADWADAQLSSKDSNYQHSIQSAYQTLVQKAQKIDLPGYVHIEFFPADAGKKAEIEELTLERLLPILEDLQSRHISFGNVAILVRKGYETSMVASYLIKHGYSVESAEGLLVSSHPAIEVLTTLLALSLRPDDQMLKARLHLVFAEHIYADSQEKMLQALQTPEDLFTDEQNEAIRHAQTLSLYEQVQYLIDSLNLASWEHAAAYLTTFQDCVYQYVTNNTADTGAFLNYWETVCEKLSIPASASSDAIQVMTIHKSKGLEFDAVIIPFLDWDISTSHGNKTNILWCTPQHAPFNQLPIVPIDFTKDLEKTHFAKEYYEELLNLYVDNLNLTYVAFTRPKRELYAFGQMPAYTQKGEPSLKNIGNLLSILLQDELTDNVYEKGAKAPFTQEEKRSTAVITEAKYCSCPIGKRLQLKQHRSQEENLTQQEFGSMMHDWLAEIDTFDEANKALQALLISGRIRESDVPQMHQALAEFKALVRDFDWFDSDSGYTILREQDILTPTGNTYRPDRIMLKGQKAVIIDYKFGEKRRPQYQEQVRNYLSLVHDMGYETEGYIIYVTLGEIDKI
ncbi:MAG: UvrD-helicase domain-containing protein [Paludibacteraceae bacterium]|nr:UvrD-helicase domain-containing protein [Paludibacteraceae bacterium]